MADQIFTSQQEAQSLLELISGQAEQLTSPAEEEGGSSWAQRATPPPQPKRRTTEIEKNAPPCLRFGFLSFPLLFFCIFSNNNVVVGVFLFFLGAHWILGNDI